jgi:hypothetical protein
MSFPSGLMKTDELMKNIRSDPRFMALPKKLNLDK